MVLLTIGMLACVLFAPLVMGEMLVKCLGSTDSSTMSNTDDSWYVHIK